ncbi:uncharacterized protein [Diadema setosum]|uniref:uncharacterized protein n=1 Tax=Diadema setosum TaxID=31175 RepID=UPI003B3B9B06
MPESMDMTHSTASASEGGQNEDKLLQALSLSLIILCALSFNFMTIFVILRTRSLRRNLHNLLMLNLAVADLGVVLASMTFSMASIFDEGRFLESHRTVCQTESVTPASKDIPSVDSVEADHHGNKEDGVPVPHVTGNRKADWRIRRRRHRTHSRVARAGAILVFTNILCWTPYILFHSEYIRVSEGHWFGVFTMWLAYCNSVLDPLVYSCMNRRVRAELWKLARRMRCCRFRRSVTFNVSR